MTRIKKMQNGYIVKATWVTSCRMWDLTAHTGGNEFYLGSVSGRKNDSMETIMRNIRLSDINGGKDEKR